MALTQVPALSSAPAAQQPPGRARKKVIFDQDNAGPLSTDTLGQLMLMQAANIDLIGITLVTGDQWLKQETAYTLRLLEMMGRTDIPVYAGAEFPILNTKEEAQLRYELYGGHRLDPWLGAFNSGVGPHDKVVPLDPPYGALPTTKPQAQHAVQFIIDSVRKYPNEVTIYVGGPLTNLALAVCLAPDIVPLVPEVVFMGTGLQHFTSSFNVFFDPEAARIVLREPWPKFTVITVDLAEEIHVGDRLADGRMMVEVIAERAQSPIKELFEEHTIKPYRADPKRRWFRMPDEMMSARIIEPEIFKDIRKMYVDVTTDPGPNYGDSMFWPGNWEEVAKARGGPSPWYTGPPPAAGLVDVVMDLDRDRFKQLFVELMTAPVRKS
jgi:inosine-uridine nucleoside N-ribohydrolase